MIASPHTRPPGPRHRLLPTFLEDVVNPIKAPGSTGLLPFTWILSTVVERHVQIRIEGTLCMTCQGWVGFWWHWKAMVTLLQNSLYIRIIIYHVAGRFSRQQTGDIFSYFFFLKNRIWHFVLTVPLETVCMKCQIQFYRENENISKCCLLEFLPSMQSYCFQLFWDYCNGNRFISLLQPHYGSRLLWRHW